MTHSRPRPALDAIDAALSEVLRHPESAWRQGLDALCAARPADAPELRRRFAVLEGAGLLPMADAADQLRAQGVPDHLGPYRILRRIGGGGMGIVWLAEDERRSTEVALKTLRPERLLFDRARERFRREIDAIARLRHSGCVQILEVGADDEQPYFAMELVRGASIDRVLHDVRQHRGSTDPAHLSGQDFLASLQRLIQEHETGSADFFEASWTRTCVKIALAAAEALAHAHARGVIHRDVKPSNLMLTASGRVVLIDFGLAFAEGNGTLTREGAVLGSLAYMAPEQVLGRMEAVGPRTDVYGLGACLYELLTLEPAFPAKDEVRLRADVLEGAIPALPTRNPAVGKDLAVVVHACLNLDSERRPASAHDLATDLIAVLHSQPIRARRDAALRRAARWARRHPVLATAAASVVTGLWLLPMVISFAIAAERDRARAAEVVAERRAYAANIAAASAALLAGDGTAARSRLELCPESLRGFEWQHLALALDGALATVRAGTASICSLTLGRRVAAAANVRGRVIVFPLQPDPAVRELTVCDPAPSALAFSEDDRELFVLDGAGALRVYSVATGELLRQRQRAAPQESVHLPLRVGSLLVDEGGARLHTLDPKSFSLGPLRLPELAGWSARGPIRFQGGECGTASASGFAVWDVRDGKRTAGAAYELTSSLLGANEDLTRMAAATRRGLAVWDRNGALVDLGLDGFVPQVVVFPADPRYVSVGCTNGAVRTYDLVERRVVRVAFAHTGAVTTAVAVQGTSLFLTGGADGAVRVWNSDLVGHLDELGDVGDSTALAFASGRSLLLGDDGASLRRVEPETTSVEWSADQGHWVLAITGDLRDGSCVSARGSRLYFWGSERGEPRGTVDLPAGMGDVVKLLVAGEGKWLFAGTRTGDVVVVDADTRTVGAAREVHAGSVTGLEADETHGRVLSAGIDGRIHAHGIGADTHASLLLEAGRPIHALAVDGSTLLSAEGGNATHSGWLVERDLRDGRVLREQRPSRAVTVVRPLGRDRLATGDRQGRLTIWDRMLLEPLFQTTLYEQVLADLVVGPDAAWIATVGFGGPARLVRARRPVEGASVGFGTQRADLARARRVMLAATRDLFWTPSARTRIEQDASLTPSVRANALRLLPPANRWNLALRIATLAETRETAAFHREELRRLHDLLATSLDAPLGGHEVMARTVLALASLRLGDVEASWRALSALPADADLGPDDGNGAYRPMIQFTRGMVHAERGERAAAEAALVCLRELARDRFSSERDAQLFVRELEDALR